MLTEKVSDEFLLGILTVEVFIAEGRMDGFMRQKLRDHRRIGPGRCPEIPAS